MSNARTDKEVVLRAFTFFQEAASGAGLQMERIQEDNPIDDKFPARRWFDWQTLMTQLWRMRKAALLMGRAEAAKEAVQMAVDKFDKRLPKVKTYRDVFEHIEAYVFEDAGRHYKHIDSGGLQTGAIASDYFAWSIDDDDGGILLGTAADASSELYADIKGIRDSFRKDNGGLETNNRDH